MLTKLVEPTFAASCAIELENHGHCSKLSRSEKEKAAAAVFAEMHAWSAAHLPMGASAEMSEAFINRGLHSVRNKFRTHPDLAQSYGVDPLTVFSVISALWSVVSWIVKWWRSQNET